MSRVVLWSVVTAAAGWGCPVPYREDERGFYRLRPDFLQLESHARMKLLQVGFEPGYFAIRDARTLRAVTEDTEEIAILAAARLGSTRLIDNFHLTLNPAGDWGILAAH